MSPTSDSDMFLRFLLDPFARAESLNMDEDDDDEQEEAVDLPTIEDALGGGEPSGGCNFG